MNATEIIILLGALGLGLPAFAGQARSEASHEDSARCEALRRVDFSEVQDAPTQIIEAKLTGASEDKPAHCQISGYVSPNVGFLLRLPSDHWNGKLAQVACGAFCGSTDDQLYAFNCNNALRKGYACIVADNGHKSSPFDAVWAYNNLQAQIDQAYRGPHVAALAGKAIVERYYGQAAKRSYFMGCSNGGRQGLMEAQRFPWDFDGIISGSPELSQPEHFIGLLWANRALTSSAGEALLGQGDLELLHQAIVAKCDLNDGVKDGLIGDPRLCAFDPEKLLCTSGKKTGCLTASQIEAVERVYKGPMTSKGERIYMPNALFGSEQQWLTFVGSENYPNKILREYFRYMAFQPSAGPTWNPPDFDFDHDYLRVGMAKAQSYAGNPDLRAFRAAGGKLLSYTGWSDVYVSPLSAVDYYDTVERTLGGRAATQDFFRLFAIPGMGHCGGGEGASAVDWLNYLEAWVEKGEAPEKLISFHVRVDDLQRGLESGDPDAIREWRRRMQFPLDPTTVAFSRPVYPYPIRAKYLGRGDPKNAASFGPTH